MYLVISRPTLGPSVCLYVCLYAPHSKRLKLGSQNKVYRTAVTLRNRGRTIICGPKGQLAGLESGRALGTLWLTISVHYWKKRVCYLIGDWYLIFILVLLLWLCLIQIKFFSTDCSIDWLITNGDDKYLRLDVDFSSVLDENLNDVFLAGQWSNVQGGVPLLQPKHTGQSTLTRRCELLVCAWQNLRLRPRRSRLKAVIFAVIKSLYQTLQLLLDTVLLFYHGIVVRRHWASLSGALQLLLTSDWLIDWLIYYCC